jgi:hypothetical protein
MTITAPRLWTGTGNHPVETSTLGGNQDDASRNIKPQIFASNGGFFPSRATYDDANFMTKKKLN